MTFTKTTRIGINDFIKLWNKAKNGNFQQIFGNLDEKIKKIWRKTILDRFSVRKTKDFKTYGTITANDIHMIIKSINKPQDNVEPKVPTLRYKMWEDREAMMRYYDQHPLKYKQWGELESKMMSFSYYRSIFGNNIEVTVTVPKKTDYEKNPDPDTYKKLEAWRSFIGSSLAIAMPEIITMIMEEIK